MQFYVGRGRVSEKFQVSMTAALVQVPIVIIGKLPADVLGIQRVQFHVMMKLRRAAERLVILEHPHGAGSERG